MAHTREATTGKAARPWYWDWWPVVVLAPVAVTATLAYLHAFSGGLSGDQEDWGQFGDYIGGLLNPFVAVFALVMLIVGVRVQREELEATRSELRTAHEVADTQRKVMQRQLFESQFLGTIRLLIETGRTILPDHRHQIEYSLHGANPSADSHLRELSTILQQRRQAFAPIISLVKVAANALTGVEKIMEVHEVEYYAATLRGFITDFEAGVLLAEMHDNQGSLLEREVNKFRLIEQITPAVKVLLWKSADRPKTIINGLASNFRDQMQTE